MKRFLPVSAALALLVVLTAMSAAQDPKGTPPPPKKGDKAAPKDSAEKSAQPQAGEAPKETPYYPLQLGNTWHYKIGDNKFSLKVAKYEKVGDLNCARVEMMVDGKVKSFEDIAVTDEGVVRVSSDNKKAEPPLLFLKLPPMKDQTWKVDSVVNKTDKSPGEKVTGTFKSGEEKVQVGMESYEAVTVSTQDLDANGTKLGFTYYFAKNVGMVKQTIDVVGQKVTIELERFEKAK